MGGRRGEGRGWEYRESERERRERREARLTDRDRRTERTWQHRALH